MARLLAEASELKGAEGIDRLSSAVAVSLVGTWIIHVMWMSLVQVIAHPAARCCLNSTVVPNTAQQLERNTGGSFVYDSLVVMCVLLHLLLLISLLALRALNYRFPA
jgi:hypothetical protein